MDAWECVYFIFSLDPEANQVQMYHKSPADNFAAIFVYITDMSPKSWYDTTITATQRLAEVPFPNPRLKLALKDHPESANSRKP